MSDIIAYGFGSWSNILKVPTYGFGNYTLVVSTADFILYIDRSLAITLNVCQSNSF